MKRRAGFSSSSRRTEGGGRSSIKRWQIGFVRVLSDADRDRALQEDAREALAEILVHARVDERIEHAVDVVEPLRGDDDVQANGLVAGSANGEEVEDKERTPADEESADDDAERLRRLDLLAQPELLRLAVHRNVHLLHLLAGDAENHRVHDEHYEQRYEEADDGVDDLQHELRVHEDDPNGGQKEGEEPDEEDDGEHLPTVEALVVVQRRGEADVALDADAREVVDAREAAHDVRESPNDHRERVDFFPPRVRAGHDVRGPYGHRDGADEDVGDGERDEEVVGDGSQLVVASERDDD